MKIIICPCGRRAKDHFVRTIENKIDLNEITNFISQDVFEELETLGEFYLWATSNGQNNINLHLYETISNGDLVLFAGNNKFLASATVVKLMRNQQIGEYYWGTAGRNGEEHWENLLLLSKPNFLNIDFNEINTLAIEKFGTGIRKMGFTVLSEDKASFIYNEIFSKELTYIKANHKNVSIPSGYSTINFKKFDDEFNEFNTIVFPNDVKKITRDTLSEPVKFFNVVLPNKVIVEDGAFSGCKCGWYIIYQGTKEEFDKNIKLGEKTTYMLLDVICSNDCINFHL